MSVRIASVRLLPTVYAAGKASLHGSAQVACQGKGLPVKAKGSVLPLNPARTSVRSLSMDCVSPLLKVSRMLSVCASPMMPSRRRSADTLSPLRVNVGRVLTASP